MSRARGLAGLWGIGALPGGPGTWGSLAALFPAACVLALLGPWAVAAGGLVIAWVGWHAVAALPNDVQGADPGWIVIDEAAGQWFALAGLASFSWAGVAAGFVLFRLFDIAKPWPVSWADRQHGALGVMLDDLIAGALAALVLLLARHLLPEVLP